VLFSHLYTFFGITKYIALNILDIKDDIMLLLNESRTPIDALANSKRTIRIIIIYIAENLGTINIL
jgi:hypothetical protein